MSSSDCTEFVEYMKSMSFAAKRNSLYEGYMEYPHVAEAEYRFLYHKGKLVKAVDNSESRFIGNTDGTGGYGYDP